MELPPLVVRAFLLVAALVALLIIYWLLRERRPHRGEVLFIEVGSPYVPLLPRARPRGRLAPLTVALAIAIASLMALLLARLFPVLLALGAPVLVVAATAFLAFVLSRVMSRPALPLRSVLINVVRDRECDLFIPYTPPATSSEEWDVSRRLRLWIAREGLFSLAVVNVPKAPDWWPVISELSRTLRGLGIPVAHIYIADHSVTAYAAEPAFLDSLRGKGGFIVWGDLSAVLPSAELQREARGLAEALLNTLLGVLVWYSRTGLATADRFSYDQASIVNALEDRVHVLAFVARLPGRDLRVALEAAPRILLNSVWIRDHPWVSAEKLVIFIAFPRGLAPRSEHLDKFECGLQIVLEELGVSPEVLIRVCTLERELEGPLLLGLISVPVQVLFRAAVAVPEPVRREEPVPAEVIGVRAP